MKQFCKYLATVLAVLCLVACSTPQANPSNGSTTNPKTTTTLPQTQPIGPSSTVPITTILPSAPTTSPTTPPTTAPTTPPTTAPTTPPTTAPTTPPTTTPTTPPTTAPTTPPTTAPTAPPTTAPTTPPTTPPTTSPTTPPTTSPTTPPTTSPTNPPTTVPADPQTPEGYQLGYRIPNFTVTTYDGTSITLYDLLREKEMVLINIWATWCPPCQREFPYMQQAYEQYQDQVEVLALSCDSEDTNAMIADFAAEYGLTFPMGQDTNYLLYRFNRNSIPTSIVIDRYGVICFIESGAITSVDTFARLFETFLGDDYSESILLTDLP